jgi:hypothetical protein
MTMSRKPTVKETLIIAAVVLYVLVFALLPHGSWMTGN